MSWEKLFVDFISFHVKCKLSGDIKKGSLLRQTGIAIRVMSSGMNLSLERNYSHRNVVTDEI